MGKMRNAYTIPVGNLKRRDFSRDLAVDGEIILKWISKACSLCCMYVQTDQRRLILRLF
jgi:hypothetical protein